jgi:hypothetical protein
MKQMTGTGPTEVQLFETEPGLNGKGSGSQIKLKAKLSPWYKKINTPCRHTSAYPEVTGLS